MQLANTAQAEGYQDEDVHQRVSRSLFSCHFPAFRNLDIEVDGGAVTITGKVQSYYEKQIALTSSQHVAGVVTLIDEIVVTLNPDRCNG